MLPAPEPTRLCCSSACATRRPVEAMTRGHGPAARGLGSPPMCPADVYRLVRAGRDCLGGPRPPLLRLEGSRVDQTAQSGACLRHFRRAGRAIDPQDPLRLWAEIRDVHLRRRPGASGSSGASRPPRPRAPAPMRAIRTRSVRRRWLSTIGRAACSGSRPLSDHGRHSSYAAQIAGGRPCDADPRPQPCGRRCFVFEPLPDPLAKLTDRVKRAFDPCGVLNPGRMYHFA